MITIETITDLSDDFDILTTPELKQRFIEHVYSYALDGCCETEQELYCFIDGLLMNLYN
jgi:hypothetical protein